MGQRATQLEFVIRRHGGRRAGAGRKAGGLRRNVPHRVRGAHDAHAPSHVTLRAGALPASLRASAVFVAVRAAIGPASRATFGVIAFSVQHDHVHLVVEADRGVALSRGVQGLEIRITKAVNRVLGQRERFDACSSAGWFRGWTHRLARWRRRRRW